MKVGSTDAAAGMIKEIADAETFEIAMKKPCSMDSVERLRESKADLGHSEADEKKLFPGADLSSGLPPRAAA